MQDEAQRVRRWFWGLWALVLAFKLAIAARLPLFVDEAFYWQEGRHLALAYSDLPGLTAWLARLGTAVGGEHALALRAPFLLLAAAVPWLVARLAAREFGARTGWQAGVLALLLPLLGTLGLLALPDVPMALATVLCIDAGARLLRRVSAAAALELALGLAIGALSHYRFLGVIAVGLAALPLVPEGRRALRNAWVWAAVAVGAAAWAPLVLWNLRNADAGLRFQLVDRHPWAFHADGLWFVAIQALVVTPLLLAALLLAARRGWRGALPVERYLAALGGLTVLGFFALGFFADNERVSFHWPLPGYLALLPLAPRVLAAWPRGWRVATLGVAGAGLLLALGGYAAVASPTLRARMAAHKFYPYNFAGWAPLAEATRATLARLPPGTRVVADNFKVGAQLGFALGDPDIAVLDHPLNHKHGRAPQLKLWGLHATGARDWTPPVLLVAGISDVRLKDLPAYYHALCAKVGPLPAARFVDVDHGRQRFALFVIERERRGACASPAMAWIDAPAARERVPRRFVVRGWAFKDGAGIARIEVTLDGRTVATARYGLRHDGPRARWPFSNDPAQPDVGFEAAVDARGRGPGRHWLGLRLHGRDGSIEAWPEQPVTFD
ncbi:MAG TPA: glycosyltransferase family 39 protein [Lysobacter sp.]|nr:glycosyltransferase family 39 protein [Lysobacter sp.]